MDYRIMTRKRGKPVLDSGNYRHGFAVTERNKIPAGTYTMIVSTYSPGQVGVFSVKVASSVRTTMEIVAEV
jgi:calpain-7